jgi:hypothetical protein
MYANERGRITGIAGMESVLTLHPDRIGPRIKNSVIKMLQNAHITGGWKSQSRQVAEQLAETFQLSVLQTRWNGLTLYAQPTAEVRDQLIEFVRADIAAFLLEHPDYHRSYYTNSARATVESLQNGTAKYLDFRGTEYTKQAIALINQDLPEEFKQANQKVIDLLNGSKPIYITTIRS